MQLRTVWGAVPEHETAARRCGCLPSPHRYPNRHGWLPVARHSSRDGDVSRHPRDLAIEPIPIDGQAVPAMTRGDPTLFRAASSQRTTQFGASGYGLQPRAPRPCPLQHLSPVAPHRAPGPRWTGASALGPSAGSGLCNRMLLVDAGSEPKDSGPGGRWERWSPANAGMDEGGPGFGLLGPSKSGPCGTRLLAPWPGARLRRSSARSDRPAVPGVSRA